MRKGMKKTLKLTSILCLILIVSVFTFTACKKDKPTEVPTASQWIRYTLNSDGRSYSVSGTFDHDTDAIIIPSTCNNKPVTSIGDSAFCDCSNLTSITIPDSVTSIGYGAFYNCSSLTSITIPDSVTSIDFVAFSGCSSLTSVEIGNGVTSIGNYAFRDCSSLTYNVKDGLKYLGNSNNPYLYLAGTTSTSITTANIDRNCKIIVYAAFEGCSSLTSITIPDRVTSIGYSAFSGCSSLTSVVIGNSVTSIGNYAFEDCSSLTSIKYEGTVSQWNAISKGSDWNSNVPATEVICSDGTVSL